MKIQFKRTFKSYFFAIKKIIKKQTRPASNFLQPPIPICRGAYIPYFKINPAIFCCLIFSENYLNPQVRINKMVYRHIEYHPSLSQLISRCIRPIFLWTLKEFISPESFSNFFLNLYIPPWLRKSFKFVVLRLLANTFMSQKIESVHYSCSQAKLSLRFLSSPPPPPRQKEITQKGGGEDYGVQKIPKLNLRGYWSQVFINSTIFATFTFLYHNLASIMVKSEGS